MLIGLINSVSRIISSGTFRISFAVSMPFSVGRLRLLGLAGVRLWGLPSFMNSLAESGNKWRGGKGFFYDPVARDTITWF